MTFSLEKELRYGITWDGINGRGVRVVCVKMGVLGACLPTLRRKPFTMSNLPHSDAVSVVFSAFYPLDARTPDREYTIKLTGDNGFKSINGVSYQLPPVRTTPFDANPNPLVVRSGERVCITMINHNADPHSMHLHQHQARVCVCVCVCVCDACARCEVCVPVRVYVRVWVGGLCVNA